MTRDRNNHDPTEIAPDYRRSAETTLDARDLAILRELATDARIARAELARRVGLSPPAVGERLTRLEESGVITGYRAEIDPARLGYGLSVLIRARPSPGRMKEMITALRACPEITRCDRVSGEDCFVAWAHVRSVAEMEAVIDRLIPFGATNTSVVQSATIPARPVDILREG